MARGLCANGSNSFQDRCSMQAPISTSRGRAWPGANLSRKSLSSACSRQTIRVIRQANLTSAVPLAAVAGSRRVRIPHLSLPDARRVAAVEQPHRETSQDRRHGEPAVGASVGLRRCHRRSDPRTPYSLTGFIRAAASDGVEVGQPGSAGGAFVESAAEFDGAQPLICTGSPSMTRAGTVRTDHGAAAVGGVPATEDPQVLRRHGRRRWPGRTSARRRCPSRSCPPTAASPR